MGGGPMKSRKPCTGCGASVNTLSTSAPLCQPCRRKTKAERQQAAALKAAERQQAAIEDERIDFGAVEWVIQGSRVDNLNPAGRKLVIRRMASRLASTSDFQAGLPPGKLTAKQLGERMGITADSVLKTLGRLPAATRRCCPVCRGDMWVLESGVVEDHGNGFLTRCGMSGQLASVSA
jgi:hypothetical protein